MQNGPRTVLVVGGGGREHALSWRLAKGPLVRRLLCLPGNPGMALLPGARCLPGSVMDTALLCEVVRREEVDLCVIGPEAPLSAGAADAILAARGERTAVFGCSALGAEIEASKVFAKGFMARHGIPTAAHVVAGTVEEAARFLAEQARAGRPDWVIKADGLRGGKGVTVCAGPDEALEAARAHLLGGDPVVVIEERLGGREASCMALVSGEDVLMLPPCEDHKTIGEGDTGPMTGGMGALCPTPVLDEAAMAAVRDQVLVPAARGLLAEGRPFRGLLYAGIMQTAAGPRVLEFNCRFGDPETQPLMMMLDGDLLPWLEAAARGRLGAALSTGGRLQISPGAAVGVVLSAAGYPGTPRTGDPITGIAAAEATAPGQVVVFHAGTTLSPSGLFTSGGRVLSVTAHAGDLPSARSLAYAAAARIHFPGAYLRRDIGARPAPPSPAKTHLASTPLPG